MRQDENDALTRVAAGTPAGELLRRYWHPVALAAELTQEKPIKAVTLLGEKLVVFRLPLAPGESSPRYGLLAERCRHRLASLAYGRVDHEGIRYTAHGDNWHQCVQALEIKTGKVLWDVTVFHNIIVPLMEEDNQWVFIKRMYIDENKLIVVAEDGRAYRVELKTGAVERLKQVPPEKKQRDSAPDAIVVQ